MFIVDLFFQILINALFLRFILDIFNFTGGRSKPSGIFLWAAEIIYTITDWLLKPVRRFIKPLRIGAFAIDFSWIIVTILLEILRSEARTVIYVIFNPVR